MTGGPGPASADAHGSEVSHGTVNRRQSRRDRIRNHRDAQFTITIGRRDRSAVEEHHWWEGGPQGSHERDAPNQAIVRTLPRARDAAPCQLGDFGTSWATPSNAARSASAAAAVRVAQRIADDVGCLSSARSVRCA